MDLQTATPKDIDTSLAALYGKVDPLYSERTRIVATLKNPSYHGLTTSGVARRNERLVAVTTQIEQLQREILPLNEEFHRRPWNRYFIVLGGHVHRGMSCSTCHPTTKYGWLPELSGCDESEMVREYGETACTVCFPDAPSMWKAMGSPKGKLAREQDAARAEREAKRAAVAAKKAAKAITNPDGSPLKTPLSIWPIKTVSEAKSELKHAADLVIGADTTPNKQRVEEGRQALPILAAALAAKLDRPAESIQHEALAKAAKEAKRWTR